jgi:hypothetical protein
MQSYYAPAASPDEKLAMARHAVSILRELVARAPAESRYQAELADCLAVMG